MTVEHLQWLAIWLRDWTWGATLNGFCINLVRPLVLVLPFAIIIFRLGDSIGVPLLFRKKNVWDQLWIGAGVGVLLWQTLLAGYLFEDFATNSTLDRPTFCERKPFDPERPFSYEVTAYGDLTGLQGPTRRYEYIPASLEGILRYGVALLAGLVTLVLGIGLFYFVLRFLVRLWDLATKNAGSTRLKPVRPRGAPLGVHLLHGIGVGFIGMGLLAWLMLPKAFLADAAPTKPSTSAVLSPDDLPPHQRIGYEIGLKGIDFAGYGYAAARNEVWKKLGDNPASNELQATRKQAIDAARSEKLHYAPVYGLFALGFLLACFVTAWLIIDPVVAIVNGIKRSLGGSGTIRHSFSPAAGVIFLLHLLLFGQTLIDYFVPFPHLVTAGGFLFALIGARAYKLKHAGVRGPGEKLTPLPTYMEKVSQSYATAESRATAEERSNLLATTEIGYWNEGEKKPLILLATSGGGSRAAAWTMKVLTSLEKKIGERGGPELPYHMRLVTGASGGMVGAANYVAALHEPTADRRRPAERNDEFAASLNRNIRGDFLTMVVHAMLTRDIPGWFLPRVSPYFANYDRGVALEDGLMREMPQLKRSMRSLAAGEKAGWCPSLVFSPMMVEDGRQLLITNLDMERVVHNEGAYLPSGERELLSREAVEFFKLFPNANDFSVAAAARMSASFPYVFPAVPLPTDPRRRVVDAGYYDNYGVNLMGAWLFTHLAWIEKRVSKIALIQIRDGLSVNERLMTAVNDGNPNALALALEGLLSPPAGLYNARTASTMFRNDNLLHLLHQTFKDRFGPEFFRTPAFEFASGGQVQLNFCLSDAEGELVDREFDAPSPGLKKQVDQFLDWWC